MGKRSERKAKADFFREYFLGEMAGSISNALAQGKNLSEAFKIGREVEKLLKQSYPDKKELISQAAAMFLSRFRQELLKSKDR